MESILKKALNTKVLKRTGRGGGGCINEGEAYLTDSGTVFVKRNGKSQVIPLLCNIVAVGGIFLKHV